MALPTRRPRRRRGWILALVALAALVCLVAALGGFRRQADVHQETVGVPLDVGPATVTVERAVAAKNYSDGWDVRVIGTCQVHEGQQYDMAAEVSGLMAIAADTPERPLGERVMLQLGSAETTGVRSYLAPGLEPMRCAFKTRFDKTFDPARGVLVQFVELQYRDNSVTQHQPERWWGSANFHRYQLPVTVEKGQ